MADKLTSIPGAKRTINALRDIGYDLNSAVADILDNSISRGKAKNIYIDFNKDKKGKYYICIIDDGIGMNSSILEEAMRIGSSNDDYTKGDLSKYGMGMKTASMSQASMITVLSKKDGCHQTAFTWDLNHVDKTDKWEIFRLNSEDIKKIKSKLLDNDSYNLEKLFSGNSWTIVIWDCLTSFQKNYNSYTSSVTSENYFNRVIDNLQVYLRLVFHRFLAGENSARKTNIYLNSKKLKGLDPFCRNEEHTIELELSDKNGNFIIESDYTPIVIKRYILPTNPKKPGSFKFSTIEAWEEASGTLSWNESQGYYVYRNNRLISWGGWYRTKSLDEHDKLARASIDLNGEHDELFTIDVKKTRIQFPEALRNHLKDNVNSKFIAEAKKRYGGSEKNKNDIINVVREKAKKVSHLSSELVRQDDISVTSDPENDYLIISNKFGKKISDDMAYKMLEAGQKIVSTSFGDSTLFWKMVPNPHNEFQVMVNTDHPFYDFVYGDAEKDKKITAIMDAFLFTMSFIELKCITNNNEMLFEQMKEVASSVLNKFIDDKIL
jgi:anti-sigma regulatory factor (Ser/Thr protein kinase)